MTTTKITTSQNEECKLYKDVYVNGKCIGTVMADDKMTPFECYQALKNNWAIDDMEYQNDVQIQRSINY
jgi:riboflavin synthase alpha subunit